MKNVSKLALFAAAGMMTAGAQAATIEVADGTSMAIEGEFNVFYLSRDTVDTSVETVEGKIAEDNADDLDGALEFEVSAARSFDNFDGYVSAIFEFTTLEEGGSGLDSDKAVAGLEGDFGQIELGHTDSVYEDLIHDAVDPFEQATLDDSSIGLDEDTMITYYSPDMNGFSFNLQLGIEDEAQNGVSKSEESFIASAAYDFGGGALHVGYDDLGTSSNSSDEIIGLAAVVNLGNAAELAVKHEMQTKGGSDTDFTGIALTLDYGAGNLYGAVKDISPDGGDSQTQYAIGVDYDLESDLKVFGELANFDGQAATDADSLIAVGLEYKF